MDKGKKSINPEGVEYFLRFGRILILKKTEKLAGRFFPEPLLRVENPLNTGFSTRGIEKGFQLEEIKIAEKVIIILKGNLK